MRIENNNGLTNSGSAALPEPPCTAGARGLAGGGCRGVAGSGCWRRWKGTWRRGRGVAAEPSHGAVESEPPLGQGGLGGGSGGLRSLSASWRRQVGQKVETQSSQSTGSEQCCDLDVVLAALCRRGPPYSIHADHLQSEPRFFAPTCPKRPARCHACCTFCLSRLIFSDDEMRSVHNTWSSTCRNKETAVHADSHL